MPGEESENPLWTPRGRWVFTPRGRLELAAVAVFLLVNAVVPFIVTDVYPVTSTGMFRDSPQCICYYHVYAPDGHELAPDYFSLQMNYQANPDHVGFGYEPPPTIGGVEEVKTKAQVVEWVGGRIGRYPQFPYVDVVQTVLGRIDSQKVGAVQQHRWRVYNAPGTQARQ